jgi:hypothetical protein
MDGKAALAHDASPYPVLNGDVIKILTQEFSNSLSAADVRSELEGFSGHDSFDRWPNKLIGGRRWLRRKLDYDKEREERGRAASHSRWPPRQKVWDQGIDYDQLGRRCEDDDEDDEEDLEATASG